jgi:hypothetical protein
LWLELIFTRQDTAEGRSERVDRFAGEIDERLHLAALANGSTYQWQDM